MFVFSYLFKENIVVVKKLTFGLLSKSTQLQGCEFAHSLIAHSLILLKSNERL